MQRCTPGSRPIRLFTRLPAYPFKPTDPPGFPTTRRPTRLSNRPSAITFNLDSGMILPLSIFLLIMNACFKWAECNIQIMSHGFTWRRSSLWEHLSAKVGRNISKSFSKHFKIVQLTSLRQQTILDIIWHDRK